MARAILVLACLWPADLVAAGRMNFGDLLAGGENATQTQEVVQGLVPQPLFPNLVPGPGETKFFMSRESVSFVERNEYMWFMGNQPIAKLQGKWMSNNFGHQTVRVYNMAGQVTMMIRNSKHVWNPFKLRYSYRVHPPTDKEKILYTINKDVFGRGFLGIKQEWRVYNGRERDGHLMYYCVGSYMGWTFKCYTSQAAYDAELPPVAWTEQEINAGAVFTDFSQWLPDNYRLFCGPGVDSALLLAMTTIIDIAKDTGDQSSFMESGSTSTGNENHETLVGPHSFK